MILLDTHTWIWSVVGDARRIGPRARRLLDRAAARDEIRVSPVSAFEIAALCTAGRLRLTTAPDAWVGEALDVPGIRAAELTMDVALEAGRVPRDVLADPLDRLLVATAEHLDAALLTSDESILAYAADSKRFRTVDARK